MNTTVTQCTHPQIGYRPGRLAARSCRDAFTLIEVMVACFVFFVVSFAILGLTMQGTVAAKSMQRKGLDPGMIASLVTTNLQLIEGGFSGDFGEEFPGSSWEYFVEEVESNGLFRVDFTITSGAGSPGDQVRMSALYFRPGSPPGNRFGGLGK